MFDFINKYFVLSIVSSFLLISTANAAGAPPLPPVATNTDEQGEGNTNLHEGSEQSRDAHDMDDMDDDMDHMMGGPKPGRYFGYLKPEASNWKIPVVLDLVVVQANTEYSKMRGILKVMLGGFNSFEYINQFYDTVAYSFMRRELSFDADNQEITISNSSVHKMNNKLMIMGGFRSASGNSVGKIKLVHVPDPSNFSPESSLNMLFPNIPMINSLTGQYKGTCEGKRTILQIEAFKEKALSDFTLNPFFGYGIRGRMATKNPDICPEDYCSTSNFSQGSYNFYRGTLKLTGRPRSLSCKTTTTGLKCGPCTLKKSFGTSAASRRVDKDKTFQSHPRTHSILVETFDSLPEIPEPRDLKGTFSGFIHHESLNKYQPFRLDVRAIKFTDRPNRPETLNLSATGWLHFENFESEDVIGYKYERRPYLDSAPEFIFEGTGETFLKVTEWTMGSIKGIWYSKSYGRVGTVELLRNVPVANMASKNMIRSYQGKIKSTDWTLNLLSQLNSDPERSTAAYFTPFTINGTLQAPGITRVYAVNSGIYDFYTNSLHMVTENGRVISGSTTNEGLQLFIPSRPTWGVILSKYRMSRYRRSN